MSTSSRRNSRGKAKYVAHIGCCADPDSQGRCAPWRFPLGGANWPSLGSSTLHDTPTPPANVFGGEEGMTQQFTVSQFPRLTKETGP
jgi:hypothetical protein